VSERIRKYLGDGNKNKFMARGRKFFCSIKNPIQLLSLLSLQLDRSSLANFFLPTVITVAEDRGLHEQRRALNRPLMPHPQMLGSFKKLAAKTV